MDKLFDTHARRLHEEQAERDRVKAQAFIADYNTRIKACIEDLYKTKGTQIARLIEIAKSLPTCSDLKTHAQLKAEYDSLSIECAAYCGQTLKQSQFIIYSRWDRNREFPT